MQAASGEGDLGIEVLGIGVKSGSIQRFPTRASEDSNLDTNDLD
jgi:hypothetical protein